MSKTRRRNKQGRYISKWNANLRPLLWLMFGVFLLGMVWAYFQKHEEQELLSPCESGCSFFMVRAYEEVAVTNAGQTASHKTQREQIVEYIFEVFGNDAVEAIVIIRKCENSKFDPKATNWNSNGTWDTGIFQINEIHGYSLEQMQDWKQNVDAAKKIFDRAGNWSPWSCSHEVGVKPFYLR